jgi:hypothetical protein
MLIFLAVFVFNRSTNLVGCRNGIVAGLSPRSTR